ncbi:hypothetical protein GOBAR_AA01850 [Gossypium barbadense]|uniref:Uncharacterized protein n=1 Tax=Gossypium barbadense TaxID=3634 RepID=A0A2P5YT23_GOSBA|nr:hypothetical protein GOBAR_AA01850 [Gossypium barbadense]
MGTGINRVTKKVRQREDDSIDMGDSMSEPDEVRGKKAHEKDDVRLQDGEVITKIIDGILSNYFLKRVHSLAEKIVVDLEKPLISKVWIDGMLQQVEYECLPKFDTCLIRDGNSNAYKPNNKEVSSTLVVDWRVELKKFDD